MTVFNETSHLPEERLSLPGDHQQTCVEKEVDHPIIHVLREATIFVSCMIIAKTSQVVGDVNRI